MADKKKTTRKPTTINKDRYASFNAKSNVANKLMDRAFEGGKPRAGTSVIGRIADKSYAWNLYRQAGEELKAERRAKTAGSRMAKAQSYRKGK